MRAALIAFFALAACGQNPAPQADLPEAREAVAGPWFICDGIDAPVAFVAAAPADQSARLLQLSKQTGASVFDGDVQVGAAEGAAGSVYTSLLLDGADVGAVRQLNPGMLETPGAAYTTPFVSVRFRDAEARCRWMPRTRLLALTDRRSVLIYEGDDGDLIYTTYDYAAAAHQTPIDLADNGRSTTFSAEVRGGEENLGPEGVEFSFSAPQDYAYRIHAGRDGRGRVDILRGGAVVQSEAFIAFQLGGAEE